MTINRYCIGDPGTSIAPENVEILTLIDTGESVQKWTRVFSTRRWVVLSALRRRKKNSVSTFRRFRLWTSFESSPVSVKVILKIAQAFFYCEYWLPLSRYKESFLYDMRKVSWIELSVTFTWIEKASFRVGKGWGTILYAFNYLESDFCLRLDI